MELRFHFGFFCLLLITQCHGVDYSATTDFCFDLLRVLSQTPNRNVLYSPTNVEVLLAMLQQGADGATAKQLEDVLHSNQTASLKKYSHFLESLKEKSPGAIDIKVATKMFLKPSFQVNEEFNKRARIHFLTNVESLDLDSPEAADRINNWISESTEGRITKLIGPGVLTPDTVLFLVGTVFFSGKWEKRFTETKHDENFTTSSKTIVKVPYMLLTKRFSAGATKEFKWVELPYEGGGFSMVLMLPNNGGNLDTLVETLTGDTLRRILNGKSTRYVYLRIPKFHLKVKTTMNEVLQKLGLVDVFTDAADLSGIGPNLKVSTFLHETSLEVDEEGSKAAAASGIVVHTLSMVWHGDEMKFNANQPFLAFIVDRQRGVPIFAAKIVDPTANAL